MRRTGGVERAGGFSPAGAWAVTIFLTLCYSISLVDRFIIAFVAEPLRHDLKISDTELGLVQGFAFSIIYAVAGLPVGAAVDRHRRMWIVSGAIAIWSLATAMCGMAANVLQLLLARVGVGAGEAGLTPAAYSLMGDMFRREQLPIAAMTYSLAPTLASASAAWISGLILSTAGKDGVFLLPYLGNVAAWRVLMAAIGLPGLALAVAALAIREPRRRLSAPVEQIKAELIPFLRTHWRLHIVFMVGAMFSVLAGYAMSAWTPSVLSRQFHWTAQETGATLGSVTLICGLMGTLIGGAACSWGAARGRDRTIVTFAMIAMLVEACAGGGLLLVTTGAQFVVVASILFVTTPMLFLVGPTLIQLVTPANLRGRMTAMALFVSIALGAGGGPLAVGAANELFWQGGGLVKALASVLIAAGVLGAILYASCIRPTGDFRKLAGA